MFKKFLIAIGCFILVVLSLGAVKVAQIKEMSSANHAPPAPAVTSAAANAEKWNHQLQAIGTLAPVQGVMLSAELDGTVVKITAENGTAVKAGDLLLELDTTIETAQLAAAQARAVLAKLERERSTELRQKNTISQAELDAAQAQFDQAQADVAAIQATIDKKKIRAPFEGRVGIRQVNLGQFVSRGTPLLPLQRLNPVFVNFYLPQRYLPTVAIGQPVNVMIDAFPDTSFTATITAINPEVDPMTRNFAVQGTLPNPQEQLRAGMFARVEVVLPEVDEVVVVPTTAVAYASYGNSVYVIEKMKGPDGAEYLGVRQQPVKLGRGRGDQIAVLEGLKPGEQVVTSGVFKLRNAMPVQVNNTVQPSNSPTPKPANT
jgi:membrane fusion protein, multidrug efflux system